MRYCWDETIADYTGKPTTIPGGGHIRTLCRPEYKHLEAANPTSAPNAELVVRWISTVGNYDGGL
ncbi:hypothetical protein MJ579_13255 [Klebsiella pneumoniae]|nr:hypothetical protein MJ579_13255 [Klebsiella pneumoniae]